VSAAKSWARELYHHLSRSVKPFRANFCQSKTTLGERFAISSCMEKSQADNSPLQKDPDDWKTGDEPMTAAQRSYLETLAQDSGETFDEELTKAEASKRIEELRSRSPRVTDRDT
jgi:hypothetical protein